MSMQRDMDFLGPLFAYGDEISGLSVSYADGKKRCLVNELGVLTLQIIRAG